MCGLLSFLSGDGNPDARAAAVAAALPATAHRGADESTVHDGGVLVSGLRPLAAVERMSDAHRTGPVDYSRKLRSAPVVR